MICSSECEVPDVALHNTQNSRLFQMKEPFFSSKNFSNQFLKKALKFDFYKIIT